MFHTGSSEELRRGIRINFPVHKKFADRTLRSRCNLELVEQFNQVEEEEDIMALRMTIQHHTNSNLVRVQGLDDF